MLMLGECPRAFGDNAIIPVIKVVKKSVNDSSNYLLINIIPIIAKVFESCMNSNLKNTLILMITNLILSKMVVVIK